ncbi:hypothetical protein MAPG_03689 [Magnaporthiopsis poae ATCC 64411]|uniref:Uncharacterized protein n=1 Tax=Magnaporthiopsis poae (strain ATCC 64411 / 73-15) TaxID=644358 RepID=A0A0C4DUP7_MAGP6|nr:hypothetical protein MAPG_03689 [Magnaporthiopsis poae ATCC 64411]
MHGQGMPASLQQMTAPRVEARSLSQLNYLAANPPKYPINPTEAKQPPLILYISRVPGSRDVILSPFKPQLKNVTGEDIANSFYLIHLDLASDELLLSRSQDSRGGSPTSQHAPSIASTHSPIARKPLPASAKLSAPPPVPPASGASASAPAPVQVPVPPPALQASQVNGPNALRTEQAALGRPSQEARSPNVAALGTDLSYPNRYGDLPADRPVLPPRPNSQTVVRSHQQPQGPVARKPLGPRSLEIPHQPAISDKDTSRPRPLSAGKFEGLLPSQTPGADHSSSFPTPVPSPKPPSAQLASQSKPQPDSYKVPSPPRSPSPSKRELVPFTLTLIRRDPVTGNQWNVGKVSSFQQPPEAPVSDHLPTDATNGPTVAELAGVAPPISPVSRNSATAPPAVSIRIETSGYAKFRGMFPTRESIDIMRNRNRTDSASSSVFRGAQDGIGGNSSVDSLSMEYFTRQLLMGYTKSWATNIRDHLRNKNRSNSAASEQETAATGGGNRKNPKSPLNPPPRPSFHRRPSSPESAGSGASASPHGSPIQGGMAGLQALQKNLDSHMEHSSQNQAHSPSGNPIVTAPGPGLRPRGYVFTSPWDGLCEFRTSSSGRGVKCMHTLGGSVGATDGGGGGGGGGGGPNSSSSQPPATLVSELRFNLPNADLFRDKGLEIQGKLDRLRLDAQRSLTGAGGHHTRGTRSVDHSPRPHHDESPDPFETEMGLGRERAGGGNRGKRAKLGKLIIYDEGLKMLDLVVAANMGVWWGAWERTF